MHRQHKFPWIRFTLGLIVTTGIIATTIYEQNASKILAKANESREKDKYSAATVAYRLVVERYPFSRTVPEARAALAAIQPALGDSAKERLTTTWLEQNVSPRLDPYRVDQLALVVWPIATILLIITFLIRCFRGAKRAMFSLLLAAIAAAGAYAILAAIGLVSYQALQPLEQAASLLLVNPRVVYGATYLLLAATLFASLASYRSQRTGSDNTLAVDSQDRAAVPIAS